MFDRAIYEEIEAVQQHELMAYTARKIFLEQVLAVQPDYEDNERSRKLKRAMAKDKRTYAPQFHCRPELQNLFEASCRRMVLCRLLEQPDTEPDNVIPFAKPKKETARA